MNNTKTTRPTTDAIIVKFAGKIKYKILKTMLMRNNPKPCLRWQRDFSSLVPAKQATNHKTPKQLKIEVTLLSIMFLFKIINGAKVNNIFNILNRKAKKYE